MLDQTLSVIGIGLVSAAGFAYQASVATGVAILVGAGLGLSNLLYDRGVPRSIARNAAPWCAGAAFLIAALSLEPGVAITLAAALTAVLVVLKVFRRDALRGVELNESEKQTLHWLASFDVGINMESIFRKARATK